MAYGTVSKRSARQYFPLETLIEDLMDIVLEQISFTEDLLNLCLVSRRLYIRISPALYRNTNLNLSKTSHRRTLLRLAYPTSGVASHIRSLSVCGTDELEDEQLQNLHKLLLQPKNLKRVRWEGVLSIPINILDVIARFPEAKIEIDCGLLGEEMEADDESSISCALLTHPAAAQLTHFCFSPSVANQFYPGFKGELVSMLRTNPVLLHLEIHSPWWTYHNYIEYLDNLHHNVLSKPTHFKLCVWDHLFFTLRELAIWGYNGGWQNLTVLELHTAEYFRAFVGRTPNLHQLCIISRGRHDIDQMQACLENATEVDTLFPKLRKFKYQDLASTNTTPLNRRVVPLGVLESMPQLTWLEIFRARFDGVPPGPDLDTPTAQEIQEIRRLCPHLEVFGLDVAQRGPCAWWPWDIIRELCRFEKPINLNIIIHRHNTKRAKLARSILDYSHVALYMCHWRKRHGLPWTEPFEVNFTVVCRWEEMRENWECPDRCYVNFDTVLGVITVAFGRPLDFGKYAFWRGTMEDLDEMDLETLKEKKAKQLFGKIGWDCKGYGKEIRRREKRDAEVANGTLYDAWTR